MKVPASRTQWTILAGALTGIVVLLLLIPRRTAHRQFRLSNGDVVEFVGMTCGTNHCDPELPVLQRFLVPLFRQGKIPAHFGSFLRTNATVVPTQMQADVLWFKIPQASNPQLYLIGRLIDDKGYEVGKPHNFFCFSTNAVLIFAHSLRGRERLATLHLTESYFPLQDENPGSFYVQISAPERDVALVPVGELGVDH